VPFLLSIRKLYNVVGATAKSLAYLFYSEQCNIAVSLHARQSLVINPYLFQQVILRYFLPFHQLPQWAIVKHHCYLPYKSIMCYLGGF